MWPENKKKTRVGVYLATAAVVQLERISVKTVTHSYNK